MKVKTYAVVVLIRVRSSKREKNNDLNGRNPHNAVYD